MTRQEAISRLEQGAPFSELYDEEWENALIMAIEALKAEPIKHGKWIKLYHDNYKCSECGNYLDMCGVNAGRGNANFCPNYGNLVEKENTNE